MAYALLSFARMAAVVSHYQAPMRVWAQWNAVAVRDQSVNDVPQRGMFVSEGETVRVWLRFAGVLLCCCAAAGGGVGKQEAWKLGTDRYCSECLCGQGMVPVSQFVLPARACAVAVCALRYVWEDRPCLRESLWSMGVDSRGAMSYLSFSSPIYSSVLLPCPRGCTHRVLCVL